MKSVSLLWGTSWWACFTSILFLPTCELIEFTPERPEISYVNEEYLGNLTLSAQRIKRNGVVLVNLRATTKAAWGNNITVDIIFYEYLSNEYKRSFVEVHKNACTFIGKESFIGELLYHAGLKRLKCPYHAMRYEFVNITIESSMLPLNFPITKGRVNFTLTQNERKDLIVKIAVHFTVTDTPRYKKKRTNQLC